ncbi:MAG: hypothetical protein ACMUIL_14660, partial [bacterium]
FGELQKDLGKVHPFGGLPDHPLHLAYGGEGMPKLRRAPSSPILRHAFSPRRISPMMRQDMVMGRLMGESGRQCNTYS